MLSHCVCLSAVLFDCIYAWRVFSRRLFDDIAFRLHYRLYYIVCLCMLLFLFSLQLAPKCSVFVLRRSTLLYTQTENLTQSDGSHEIRVCVVLCYAVLLKHETYLIVVVCCCCCYYCCCRRRRRFCCCRLLLF